MNLKTVLGSIVVAVLLFFGIIFAWSTGAAGVSTEVKFTRLIVAAMMFIIAFALVYYIAKKPTTIVQKFETSGEMKAVTIKCPHCSASISAESIKMVSGVPYATCPYCGHGFEVVEEPKW